MKKKLQMNQMNMFLMMIILCNLIQNYKIILLYALKKKKKNNK
jgi:hypothetical protein